MDIKRAGLLTLLAGWLPWAAYGSVLSFDGELDAIATDVGGIYTGTALGTSFSGQIDDGNANGFITDGTTTTAFSCCIAAGALEVSNNEVLTSDEALLLNMLLGSSAYSAGDVFDIIDLEGDAATTDGGRIEVGLSFIFDAATFNNSSLANYPFDPSLLQVSAFFIFEEDANGNELYSAAGLLDQATFATPVAPPIVLVVTGGLAMLARTRRAQTRRKFVGPRMSACPG